MGVAEGMEHAAQQAVSSNPSTARKWKWERLSQCQGILRLGFDSRGIGILSTEPFKNRIDTGSVCPDATKMVGTTDGHMTFLKGRLLAAPGPIADACNSCFLGG